MNEILHDEILKQSLMRSDTKYVESKRVNLWVKVLKIDKIQIGEEYQKFYNQYQKELNQQICDQIDVDVIRSFHSLKEI